MSAVPAVLSLSHLADDEQKAASGLLNRLEGYRLVNGRQAAYYDGEQRVRDLGISVPPHMRDLLTVVGWPGTVVDVLEERLDHDGWLVPGVEGDLGVTEIVEQNRLHAEWSGAHLDAFIHGIAFGVVGTGGEGEPDPLVTLESPTRMTVSWDRRKRRVTEALLTSTNDQGDVVSATLWHGGQVIELGRSAGRWEVERRSPNRLLYPPIVRIANRPRTGDSTGRSEITPAVRAYTDNAVRTVLGMEVAREFFIAPQLWLLGADESSFVGPDGKPKTGWETYIGRVRAIPGSDGEKTPDVKQIPGASPAPFIESLRGLAQMLSAEAGMPVSYLGLMTDNPPSADSVRALETRVVKRAERRQSTFGADEGWLMRLAIWVRDGEDPGVTPRPDWKDAATPTRSAAADEATKLVSVDVLPPHSEVTQKRVGLSEADRDQLAEERRRDRGERALTALAAAAEQARRDPQVAELSDRRDPA